MELAKPPLPLDIQKRLVQKQSSSYDFVTYFQDLMKEIIKNEELVKYQFSKLAKYRVLKITEKNKDIVTLGKVIAEFSETIRKKYNDYGANTEKLAGWIVRQSSDPFQLRNAVDVLNLKNKKNIKEINGTPERNLAAWKEYILPKLDQKRTFANTDGSPQAIDEFLDFAYNSLIKNQNQVVDIVSFAN